MDVWSLPVVLPLQKRCLPPSLLLNTLENANHRVRFKLEGTRSNRAAIGARLIVQAGKLHQLNEVGGGSSHLSQNDLCLHFGLGSESKIDAVEIRWPSGKIENLKNLAADFISTRSLRERCPGQ